jgi:hypothetical protein
MTEELRSVLGVLSISLDLHADYRVMIRGICRLRVGQPTPLSNVTDLRSSTD